MALDSLLQIAVVCGLVYACSGTCTFPTHIRGNWISSEKNDLVFSASSFSTYQVHTFATTSFSCEIQDGTKYMVKSNLFSQFNLQFYAYMCLDFQQVTKVTTGDLYYYYKASVEEQDANYERVVIKLSSFTVSAASEICTVSDYTNVRYSMLLKNDTIDKAVTTCPIPFLGNFAYTYDTGSGNLCSSGSYVQVCSTKTTMNWDYTQCSQIQAYSAGGVTKCVYSTSSNGVYTVHVYNMDSTTDQSTTYRFTCYQVTGYETVYATQYPGDCQSSQNTTYVASPGASLVMTASLVCAYDEETTAVLSAGVIAAIVICCILFIGIIIALIIYYFYYKRKKRKEAEREAANRKIDPDELSPNMRLGLPDESKYDLDRLMYSPDMKNGLIKRNPRKDMLGLEGLEGYNEGDKYMDEDQRQTALEAHMFTEKRKRRDKKDEFSTGDSTSKVFSDRIKDLAKGRKRPLRAAALAKLKLKLRPRPRPMVDTPDGSEGGRGTRTKDIVIQVEEAEGDNKRKTRFADEDPTQQNTNRTVESKSAKKLEDVETLSDIVDNELGVDDLSDDEPNYTRLKLLNLGPEKKKKRRRRRRKRNKNKNKKGKGKKVIVSKYIPYTNNTPLVRRIVLFRPNSGVPKKTTSWNKPPVLRPRSRPWSKMVKRLKMARLSKISPFPQIPPLSHRLHGELNAMRPKDRFSLGANQQTSGMPHNTRFMPPKSRQKSAEDEFIEPMPLNRKLSSLTPLARIHRKDNPKAWKEALGDINMESMDLEELKKKLPENRWKKLLEELYRDKKYFDYVKKSTSNTEKDLLSTADESLQFLYGRALFWEQQQPIPARPPSHVKRMYSRYESPKPKSSKGLQRSSTTLSRSGHKRVPRTPSTQVSKLKRRDKKAKDEANEKEANLLAPSLVYFEGGTQTDFSPVPPMSPYLVTNNDNRNVEKMSLAGSIDMEERFETPVIPYSKEVTKSDIKLEEFDLGEEEEGLEEGDPEGDNEEDGEYGQYDAEMEENNQTYEDVSMAV